MKCLVLGATGFLGTNLIEKLAEHGHEIQTYSNNQNYSSHFVKEYFAGNFIKGDNLANALDGIDVVYHLISTSLPSLPFNRSSEDVSDNLISTIRLLNLMAEAGNQKIIFASSGGTIYGDSTEPLLDESHPTNPICSYGISKLSIEKYIQLFTLNSSVSAVNLRVSNAYGKHHRIGRGQGLINTLCHNVSKGQPIEIWGDGKIVRDYLHVDDVSNALLASLKDTGRNLTVNISSGSGLSVNQIAEKILTITDSKAEVIYHPSRKFDVQQCVLSNHLAKDVLGWEPTVGIDEGILRTYQWYQQESNR
jgi:UDP-glucose 4-epimerase